MPCSIVDFVSTLVPLHVIAQVVVVARGQFYNLGAWRLRRICYGKAGCGDGPG